MSLKNCQETNARWSLWHCRRCTVRDYRIKCRLYGLPGRKEQPPEDIFGLREVEDALRRIGAAPH
jgi:hypothetical protein